MFTKDIFFDRKFLVTGGALLLALLFFAYFPNTDRLSAEIQSLITFLVFFLVFPILYVKYVLKESRQELGFRAPSSSLPADWFRTCATTALGFILFFFIYQIWPALRDASQLPFSVERSFLSFVQYELFILAILFFYEVFFRGFVMLVFLRRFGAFAILFQWLLFLLFLLASNGFDISQATMILFTPLAGFVAYRSRSLWHSFIASGLFFMAVDVFLLLHNR